MKGGQIVFLLIGVVLILFIFLVIILGNLNFPFLQFSYIFKNFITLRSLSISGLRYALYQINQNPNFTTSSALVSMPQGYFNYSVLDIETGTKKVIVQGTLNEGLKRTITATVTIDSLGTILSVEMNEE